MIFSNKKPYIVKILETFYKKIRGITDPEQLLHECYIFFKTYDYYEPDVSNSIKYSDNSLKFTPELYKKMTGLDLKENEWVGVIWWIMYGCRYNMYEPDFVKLYELKFPEKIVEIVYPEEPNRVYVVIGSIGEYSNNEQQAIAVFKSREQAIKLVDKLNDDPTSYYDVHFTQHPIDKNSDVVFYIKSAEMF